MDWFTVANQAISAASAAANRKKGAAVPPPRAIGAVPVEDILDTLERRGGGTGGGYKGAGKGALKGASYGSYVPGLGTAVGAGVGAIIGGIHGAVTKHAKTAPKDIPVAQAKQAIEPALRQAGKTPAPGEIETMLRGQGWAPEKGHRWVGEDSLRYVLNTIIGPGAPQAAAVGGPAPAPAGPTRGTVAPANPQREALQAAEAERRRQILMELLRK